MKKCGVLAVSIGIAAAACQAQWTGQLLNSSAVTNEFGEMIVWHDGGGDWGGGMAADKAFDGKTETFYDAVMNQSAWAGFELESPKMITRVRYFRRTNNGEVVNRSTGIQIQAANRSDFADAVTLYTIPPPSDADGYGYWWGDVTFADPARTNSFTFVRYYCPLPDSYGNLAELEFYGADPLDVSAGLPPTPVLTFEGCVNWRMNLCWLGEPDTAILYEVQRKIAHEPDFYTVSYAYATQGEMHYMDATLLMYQEAEYRIRAVSNLGVSAWTSPVTGLPRNGATGQWIGLQGSYWGQGMTGDKAFDGDMMTFYNAHESTSGLGTWTGLDFGAPKTLAGLRFAPRHSDFPNADHRMDGGWFETDDDPAFLNPILLHTVQTRPPTNGVTEVVFLSPVTARYARYCSPDGGWGNVAEVEFIQAPTAPNPPTAFAVTVLDFTNAHAVLTWRLSDVGSLISSTLVYRATSVGGPYACVTPDGVSGTTWTDATGVIGVRYYYKVSALTVTPGGPLEGGLCAAPVEFTPFTRIERDWGHLSEIKSEMSLLGLGDPYQGNPEWDVQAMFDDDLDSFVNIDAYNPAIGVDLAKPYCIQAMRFAARPDAPEGIWRLNGVELRGSNNPDYTSDSTPLATFTGATAHHYVTLQTANQEPFRYIFLQRPDAEQFHGNIAELELYGWSPGDAPDVLRAPTSLTLALDSGEIRLDWAGGLGQDAYRVERSPDGDAPWTLLDTVQGETFTDAVPLLGQRSYYRIVALRQAPTQEEGYSAVYSVVAYTPGTGTGLRAHYFTNYAPWYSPAEGLAGVFTEGTPNWDMGAWAPVRPEVPIATEYFRIVYNGTLTVPFTGNYTFYVTSDDGVALWLDGQAVLNSWYDRAPSTGTVTVPLTAGEIPFRMDYYQGSGGKALKLEWASIFDRTVIPTVQFNPLDLLSNEDVFVTTGAWQGRTFGTGRLGYHTLNVSDGSITVAHGDGGLDGGTERYHYVWQDAPGRDFIFEAKVEIDPDPLCPSAKAFLMVRNELSAGSPLLAPSLIATAGVNVMQRLASGAAIDDAITWAGPMPGACHLRVKRINGMFTFAYRDPSGGEWVTYHTFEDTEGVFVNRPVVGIGMAPPVQGSQRMFQTATFSEISLRPLGGTLILIR